MSAWPFGDNRRDPDRPSIFAAGTAFGVRRQKTGAPITIGAPFPVHRTPAQPQEGSRVSLPGSLAPKRMP